MAYLTKSFHNINCYGSDFFFLNRTPFLDPSVSTLMHWLFIWWTSKSARERTDKPALIKPGPVKLWITNS